MATIQERRAAYRKAKEELSRRQENALEVIRWQMTMRVIEEFPRAEFQWLTPPDTDMLLEMRIRLDDFAYMAKFGPKHLEMPGIAVAFLLNDVLHKMRCKPLEALFVD